MSRNAFDGVSGSSICRGLQVGVWTLLLLPSVTVPFLGPLVKGTSMYLHPFVRLLTTTVVTALVATPLTAVASPGAGMGTDAARAGTSEQRILAGRVERARAAAHWQGRQLSGGRIQNEAFGVTDWGLTIETAFALAADRSQPRRLAKLEAVLKRNYYRHYATSGRTIYAGALAKVLVASEVLGARPRHFGGHDLRRGVLRLMAPASAGSEAGRFRDSRGSDTSNTYSQALAVLGLARSGSVPRAAVTYLTKQQCNRGYFRIFPTVGSSCTRSGSAPDVDATALAVQALVAARRSGVAIPRDAISRAARWLVRAQKPTGGFGGGSATPGANANSTGVAAQALAATNHPGAARAAARYVAGLQITARRAGSGPARRELGAVGYNLAALRAALRHGIRPATRDQFRRTTPQAFFAFRPKPLSTLTAP